MPFISLRLIGSFAIRKENSNHRRCEVKRARFIEPPAFIPRDGNVLSEAPSFFAGVMIRCFFSTFLRPPSSRDRSYGIGRKNLTCDADFHFHDTAISVLHLATSLLSRPLSLSVERRNRDDVGERFPRERTFTSLGTLPLMYEATIFRWKVDLIFYFKNYSYR